MKKSLAFAVGVAASSIVASLVWANREATDSPHQGSAGDQCLTCHTVDAWTPIGTEILFDHATTGFALDQGHAGTSCRDCHQSLVFRHVGTACADCHLDAHGGELGLVCEICHAPAGWNDSRAFFDAHNRTLFPLLAPHAALDCQSCHRRADNWEYAGTPVECDACHIDDYRTATSPDHVASGFSTLCTECHSPAAPTWQSASFGGGNFRHPASFPLDGAHGLIDCESCHTNGFAGTPTDCEVCHLDDYNATVDPDHRDAGFPTSCQTCHSTSAWIPGLFNHDMTAFPLRGQHVGLDCESCHTNGFTGTPNACVGCHRAEYVATRDPNHVTAGFSERCESCHDENGWEGAEFDHSQTRFPLRNSHAGLDCESCHANGFTGTSTDCFSCHRADFDNTKDPDHRAAGFPTSCETCHNDRNWGDAEFNHDQTGFPLRNAHAGLDCESCHANGFTGTSSDCFSCHRADFDNTRDPDHRAAGFPTSCETCHNDRDWDDAEFNHNQTGFPLRDSHADVDCDSCHAAGFAGTPRDCFSCHADDYDRANDPDHRAAGFPTTCETCHDATRWEESNWDHDDLFPIYSGEHRGEWNDCSDCHVSAGTFTVFECIFCHEHNQSEMDDEHDDVRDYRYESQACFSCHPDGRE